MPSIINSDNGVVSGSSGLKTTGGNDGITVFQQNGTESARIDSSGNVGIGTSNTPSNKDTVTPKLVVNGSGVAGAIQVVRNTTVGAGGAILELTATRGSDFNSYTILQSGDGVGSVAFGGADGNEFVLAGSVQCQVDGTPGDNDMPGRLIFNTTADGASSPSERMRIDSSGNLLVGTTAQIGTEKFGVLRTDNSSVGIFKASSTTFNNDIVQIICSRSGATTEYNALTVFDNNTTLKMLIRANGNLLNANNSYGSLSDIKLKENIVDATPKLEKINKVRVVNFNMIGDQQKQIGVVAQELEQIFPGMVEEDQEGIKAVKYSVFVPMLIKAMQEQQQMIATLQAEVAELKAKV